MFKDFILVVVLLITLLIVFYSGKLLKELKKSEGSYRTLTEKYEAVVSNIRVVIFQLNSEGELVFANNSWEKLTGFSLNESLGKPFNGFFKFENISGFTSQIQTKMFNTEIHLTTKNQQQKIVEVTMMPLLSADGFMYGYSGSINDISERKEQECLIKASKQNVENLNIELEKRVQEEVKSNRQKDHILIQQSRFAAMGEMIASIGHQWRQPLNSLSLLIQDVSEAQTFGEINDEYIDRFTKESMVLIKHMSRTINDFRKFYLPNKEKETFIISEAIEDALSIFSINLKSQHIQVEFEYRGQQKAYGFQNEFSQVILNILTNARDIFVERNIRNRQLNIKIDDHKDTYLIKIMDNAGGIESSIINKIFEPYFTTRANGTGIGLYMSKIILENMGGSVNARNLENGAEFMIFVPKRVSTRLQEPA